MLGNENPKPPAGQKHDGYDTVRFAILGRHPDIDPVNAVEILRSVHSLISTGKKSTTTYTEIEKETGLSRRTIVSTVDALESLGYLIVNREKSNIHFICVNDRLFFGPQIAKETEECLQELIIAANEYTIVRNIVGNLPEEARAHFENKDLKNAIRIYNEAVKRLIEAKQKILPLIEWRNTAFKISTGPRFYYDYMWR